LDLKKRYTYADYLTWADDKRREIINGFVHLMAGPTEFHARITSSINTLMGMMIRSQKGKCRVYHAPFDVRLPVNDSGDDDKIYDVVQPDICVVCDLSKLDEKGCMGAPDLIVEILSPSTAMHDRSYKKDLYERCGVKEYWIIDTRNKVIEVYWLVDGKYVLNDMYFEPDEHWLNHHSTTDEDRAKVKYKFKTSLFDGLVIDIREIFEGIDDYN